MTEGYKGYGATRQFRRKSQWFNGYEYKWDEKLQEYVRWVTQPNGHSVPFKLSEDRDKIEKIKKLMEIASGNKQQTTPDKTEEETLKDIQGLERLYKKTGDPIYARAASKLRKKLEGSKSKPETETKEPEPKSEVDSLKERQLAAILASNPMTDDYHTGIRSVDDILTPEEAFKSDNFSGAPDWKEEDARKALASGQVTIYSSNPIKTGVFVTPSQMEAKNYAGKGKVYSSKVPLSSVAWIDSMEGQYCSDAANAKSNEKPAKSKPEYPFEGTLFSVKKLMFRHEFTADLDKLAEIMKEAKYYDFYSVEKEFDKWRKSYEQSLMDKEPKAADFDSHKAYMQAHNDWIDKRAELSTFKKDFQSTLNRVFLKKKLADPKYEAVEHVWASKTLGMTFEPNKKIYQKDLLKFDLATLEKASKDLIRGIESEKQKMSDGSPEFNDYFHPDNYNVANETYQKEVKDFEAYALRVAGALEKAIKTLKKQQQQDVQPQQQDVQPSKKVPEPLDETPINFPDNPDSVKYVKSLGGSTGAELVEAEDGTLYVRKRGNSEGHILNECQVDAFYRAQGVRVPQYKVYDTENGPVKLSRYLDDAQSLDDWWKNADQNQREEMTKELRKGFAVDILTGNWDVVGMDADNILIDQEGKPWRIDNGGALSYRAQGAKKTDEQWGNGFIDDLWTMTGNGERIGVDVQSNLPTYFGQTDVGEMARAIDDQDWSNALDCLSKQQRAIVEKRLGEAQQLAAREKDFSTNGYTRDFTLAILDETYKYSKRGLREACTFTCDFKNDDYGWFRTNPNAKKSSFDQITANRIKDDFFDAVEEVNRAYGPGGNSILNVTTIFRARRWRHDLDKGIMNGLEGASYYRDVLKQIDDAISGTKVIPYVDFSKPLGDDSPLKTASEADSLSKFLRLELGNRAVDFVEHCNSSHGGNSYDKRDTSFFEGDACRMKLMRLRAQGYDVAKYSSYDELCKDATNNGYYVGDPNSVGNPEHFVNIADTFEFYKTNMDAYNRDFGYMTKYNAAIQIALENASFTNNDKATRSLILGRSENEELITGSGVKLATGERCKHRTGVNESHSIWKTCTPYSNKNYVLTMMRVPYSRINGLYMMESIRQNMFCDDDENEVTADTHGLPIYLMNDGAVNNESFANYMPIFEQAEKGAKS